jgi:hypothetical protein
MNQYGRNNTTFLGKLYTYSVTGKPNTLSMVCAEKKLQLPVLTFLPTSLLLNGLVSA